MFKFSQGCRGIGRQFDTDGFFVFEKKCAHRQVKWAVFSPNNIWPVVNGAVRRPHQRGVVPVLCRSETVSWVAANPRTVSNCTTNIVEIGGL